MTASKIEWTDRSDWNPVRGCTRVSRGCGGPGDEGGCYAEVLAARFSKPGQWGHGFAEMKNGDHRWTGKVELQQGRVTLPLSWREPAKIFVSSTSDVFHEKLFVEDIDKIFAVALLVPHHTLQILTKRPGRARQYLNDPDVRRRIALAADMLCRTENNVSPYGAALIRYEIDAGWPDQQRPVDTMVWPLPNVWLGTSVEDQDTADTRIPKLLQTPAVIRFISAEPLLGPIDLTKLNDGGEEQINSLTPDCWEDELVQWRGSSDTWQEDFEDWFCIDLERAAGPMHAALDWVICGGESGVNARPMHPYWARSLRDQCAAANVPFFFKQWGEWAYATARASETPGRFALAPVEGNSPITPINHYPRQFTKFGSMILERVGKSRAGRVLDGIEHNAFPQVSA